MAVITKIELSKDLQKVVMQTITRQGLQEITPNTNARSYRSDLTDGVYTLVEEFLIDQGTPQYSADGTVSSEPLESHSLFATVGPWARDNWATWKRNPMADSLAQANSGSEGPYWTPEVDGVKDAQFAVFYGLYSKGIESYYAPRVVVKMTELKNTAPDLSNVGKIDGDWSGSGICVPSQMTFILSSVHAQQEGAFWRITKEWLGSNPLSATGWDTTIYGS